MTQGTESKQREKLSRDRIIDAALQIMDDEGLDAVSMRRVGRELGVEAMSLYHHVRDKDDLLLGIRERVLSTFVGSGHRGRLGGARAPRLPDRGARSCGPTRT